MRLIKKITTAVSALAVIMAVKTAPLFAALQDAKIEVKTTESHGTWYTQPVWIAIGIIALVLIIALISMAGRRDNTTVVK
jgi:hypothetical protein